MPTTRHRYMITESEQVTRALDDAAKHWPADRDNPSTLLLRLVEEGHHTVRGQRAHAAATRRAGVASTSGALTGMFGDGYLTALREDWPA